VRGEGEAVAFLEVFGARAPAPPRSPLWTFIGTRICSPPLKLDQALGEAAHGLRGAPFAADIRNLGMAATIELESDPAARGRRGYEVIQRAFWDENLFVRVSGDTIALSSPLIVSELEFADIIQRIRRVLHKLN
jgi:adenosylmethionine-8-amino-7-oxononanoate aminotransferase